MTTMSMLEQRYRRLLRLLPAAYRVRWQDEMVTTFLASMHTDDLEQADLLADFGRPSWPEVASVVALAVRLRLGGVTATPRNVMWGNAIRLVALTGLLVHSALTAGSLLMLLWLSGRAPWLALPTPETDFVSQSVWFRIATLAGFVWLPAYLALLSGQRRVSLVLALLALLGANFALLLNPIQHLTISHVAFSVFDAVPVLALAAFHRDAPPIRWRPWLVALPIGFAVVAGAEILTMPDDLRTFPLLDLPAIYCVALVLAAAVHLARRAHGDPSWTLALAVLCGATLGLRVLTLMEFAGSAPAAQQQTLLLLGVAEAGAVLAVAAPLVMLSLQTGLTHDHIR